MECVRASRVVVPMTSCVAARPTPAQSRGACAVLPLSSRHSMAAFLPAKQSLPCRRRAIVCEAEGEDAAPAEEKPKQIRSKGDIVSVDKAKYTNSPESLANHDVNYTGIQFIFEARGEVLEVRNFQAGEYCLVAWAGHPNPPAWLPSDMLKKEPKLNYTRT
eukprot:jgi/Mesvir1/10113/Mv16832-RA.1